MLMSGLRPAAGDLEGPAPSCADFGRVASTAKSLSNVLKRGIESNVYVGSVTGKECLRVNSVIMQAASNDELPYVEFGWRIGSDCSHDVWVTEPVAFMARATDSGGYRCNDTPQVFLTQSSWGYTFRTMSNLDGTWTTYLDSTPEWTTINLNFAHGSPFFMNSERHYWVDSDSHCQPPNSWQSPGCRGATSNWGNFDSIQENYYGNWQNV
jgi:hypothetical protein